MKIPRWRRITETSKFFCENIWSWESPFASSVQATPDSSQNPFLSFAGVGEMVGAYVLLGSNLETGSHAESR